LITKFIARNDLAGSRIDREAGIIKGVSLIALGDARGHGKSIDQKTLKSVIDCAKKYGEGLRVKFNPNTFTHGAGSLAGFIPPDTLRMGDDKALGDLHLYKHFPAEAMEYLAEIIDRTPGNIGLSIEFTGDDEDIKGEKFARCDEIFAATIVDLPAANPTGLFAVKELTKQSEEVNRNDDGEDTMTDEQIEKLAASLGKTFTTALAPVIQKLEEKKDDNGNGNGNGNGDDDKEKEEMAAGVTAGDDDETKKQKVEAYRASKQTVSTMSATQLSELVKKQMMQFFSATGGKPAKVTVEPEKEGDPFEARIKKHMEAGAGFRGLAINRARRDAPKEYNEWMAKNHPRVQTMERK
jgi:hypothetical protein